MIRRPISDIHFHNAQLGNLLCINVKMLQHFKYIVQISLLCACNIIQIFSHGLAKKKAAKNITIFLKDKCNKKSQDNVRWPRQQNSQKHPMVSSNLLGLPHFTSNDENSRQRKMTKSICIGHLACRPVPGKWLINYSRWKRRKTHQTTDLSSRPETSRMPVLRSRS